MTYMKTVIDGTGTPRLLWIQNTRLWLLPRHFGLLTIVSNRFGRAALTWLFSEESVGLGLGV